MKQSASVDERDGVIAVTSYSQTEAGFWATNGVILRLPGDVANEIVGAAVSVALDASRQDVPTPAPDADIGRPLLRLFGVRSWGPYMVGTRSVGVRRWDGNVEVVPTRNRAKDGFVEMPDAVVTVEAPGDAELGAAVREGLARAV